MGAKTDPVAVLLKWLLREEFEPVFGQATGENKRPEMKLMGTVTDVRHTEKGMVERKSDQVIFVISTSTQAALDPLYALQAASTGLFRSSFGHYGEHQERHDHRAVSGGARTQACSVCCI